MELLHFTGQVWRPPYEASSQLLQVTAGCTHNKCKFCSLYHGTKFRLSPITEVEEDLKVIQKYQPRARRVFLTGANPFALSYNRLLDLGLLIRKYLRHCESIGMFARISDIKPKTVEELRNLRHLGLTVSALAQNPEMTKHLQEWIRVIQPMIFSNNVKNWKKLISGTILCI